MHTRNSSSPQKQTEATPPWPSLLAGGAGEAQVTWGRGLEGLRAKELSLVMHLLLAVLILFPIFNSFIRKGGNDKPPVRIFFPGFPQEMKIKLPGDTDPTGGGSGGARENDPARHGGLTIFSWMQKTPPSIIRNFTPKLPAAPTLVGPPEIVPPPSVMPGDPSSNAQTNSQGRGGGNGFGDDCCGGIGPGKGRGGGPGDDWGTGGLGKPQVAGRNGVGYPECVYCPTPTFSEEARKSKTQGSVTPRVVIGLDGRATNIRVVRGLGMGLDERAMDAVRNWRFKPALGPAGKPVPVELLIEVTFRLL